MASNENDLWKEAFQAELDGIKDKMWYEWVDESEALGYKIIGSQWVFDIKRLSSGTIARYKARLVVRGDQ